MTDSSNRFENLLNRLHQLPDDQRQRPRDYLDQDSLLRKHDDEVKEILFKYRSPKQAYIRHLPPEVRTVKALREQLEAMISARYERYHSPAKVRHPRASNWDVPGVESSSWIDLAESLEKQGNKVLGVKILGLTLTRHPKTFPTIDIEIDCSIDGELHLFSWAYSPNRKHLNYVYERTRRIATGVRVEPDIDELKRKFII